MYAILVAAARFLLGWIFRGAVVKFIILGALYYVATWIGETVLSQLDISSTEEVQTLLDAIPDGVLWAMGVFRFDIGLPLLLGAELTRFLIRRIPIFG